MANLAIGATGIPTQEFTGLSKKLDTFEGIRFSGEAGLQALELAFVRQVYLKPDKAKMAGDVAREVGLTLSIHAQYFINMNPKTEKSRNSSRGMLENAARIGHEAGARNIVFHPASYLGNDPKDVYPIVEENVLAVAETLRKDGIDDVILRPEIGGKLAAFGTLDELIALSKADDMVGPCIDFAHIVARSNGKYNSKEAFGEVFAQIKDELGQKALEDLHIHFAGIEYNDKGEINHLNLRDKKPSESLDYEGLAEALHEYGVGGVMICESPEKDLDAKFFQDVYDSFAR